jgi:rubrerythrin
LSVLVDLLLGLEEQGRSYYQAMSEDIRDDRFAEFVGVLAIMKEENLCSLTSLTDRTGGVLWKGAPLEVIKERCLAQIGSGRKEESETRALEYALRSEEDILTLYAAIRDQTEGETKGAFGRLVDRERKLLEELRLMIFVPHEVLRGGGRWSL